MNRRRWLTGAFATAATALLAACGQAGTSLAEQARRMGEGLTRRTQRLLIPRDALAPTYSRSDISPDFKANGSVDPAASDYVALKAGDFADYRLVIDGLVERPLSLSLAELRARPSQSQITKHDCVEGWTSIGEWTGVRLETLLDEAGLKPEARFIVFHCFDALDQREDGDRYYESIDLVDAFHPQTILAWAMNGETLPVPHGAPLRLRVERQIGYKHAKYIRRIEAVESFAHIGGGKGGYWEDRGYEWFAAI
ncbi:MAG: molybdopterin-dependent oxidoreductase [Alphaproteobacteria bacterium]|jgi:DMSO/TMAO reductase YedYZ molybdopterin-dependent catalytic subunit|nr:molybdopterin-dependent oxidoreductase [Alphaproteobacteria bacterium]MBU2040631.1 molybdopterin-dependent oxidoreductase [Alphaproteobacteria bacterium]MBU2125686.1 molybdopterin-dependent oxidoreductase [Alphaproteobacteria bacterium]MBU2209363.1 molybdopterin-dependent oxidoreductase [Alphaproteobacteria bacterium]